MLPKKDFFSKEVSVTSLQDTNSVFGDENYDDEDDDLENKDLGGEGNAEMQRLSPSGITKLQPPVPSSQYIGFTNILVLFSLIRFPRGSEVLILECS